MRNLANMGATRRRLSTIALLNRRTGQIRAAPKKVETLTRTLIKTSGMTKTKSS